MDIDINLAELSKTIDPAVLGRRIKIARIAAGLIQAELAANDSSVAYVSRIEAGKRRPDLKLLTQMASRLNTTVEDLLRGVTRDKRAELRLTVDYAHLSLRSGDAAEAYAKSTGVLDALGDAPSDEIATEARLISALALESLGQLDDAILLLEDLMNSEDQGAHDLKASIALSRCYREAGDLNRAIESGEAALSRLEGLDLAAGDEAIQLAVTVAAAHFDRGDAGHAVRLCKRAIEKAEHTNSATARASAYWNASIMESEQGRTASAVSLANHALVLLEREEDNRHVSRLKSQLGMFMLSLDPPDFEGARVALETAARDLDWSSATTAEKANNQAALARAHLLGGDIPGAQEILHDLRSVELAATPMVQADIHVLNGQLHARQGDFGEATSAYRSAVLVLTGIGADRRAAQLWFELGYLLDEAGQGDDARNAYRQAAASTGLTIPRQATARNR